MSNIFVYELKRKYIKARVIPDAKSNVAIDGRHTSTRLLSSMLLTANDLDSSLKKRKSFRLSPQKSTPNRMITHKKGSNKIDFVKDLKILRKSPTVKFKQL